MFSRLMSYDCRSDDAANWAIVGHIILKANKGMNYKRAHRLRQVSYLRYEVTVNGDIIRNLKIERFILNQSERVDQTSA